MKVLEELCQRRQTYNKYQGTKRGIQILNKI